MKPRLRLIRGIWYCCCYDAPSGTWHSPKGIGYTPAEAFRAWESGT